MGDHKGMCPSLPLGRRERDMEAGGEVGGTAPRGHLWGRLQGILAVGLSPSHGGGVWVDVRGSGCTCLQWWQQRHACEHRVRSGKVA